MRRIMSESNGRYSQVLEIGEKVNRVTYSEYGEVLYEGVAHNIVDTGDVLMFNSPTGKKYHFVKYIKNNNTSNI